MKICLFHPYEYNGKIGGTDIYVAQLSSYLIDNGHDVFIICPSKKKSENLVDNILVYGIEMYGNYNYWVLEGLIVKKGFKDFKQIILNNDKSNVVIPTLYNLHNNTFSSNVKFIIKNNELKLTYGNTFDPNVFPGGAVFIKKSVFDENGYYDDQMLVGFEDFEFAIRLYIQKKHTLNIKLVSKLVIIHDHRILKNINNINTVKVRYDLTELDKSFDRLITKHKLVFNHDYIEWTKLQVSEMTSNSDSIFIKGIKLFKMYFHILKHQC
jgi:hypothetical protein